MEVKKIDSTKTNKKQENYRPQSFDNFIGQSEIKKVLKAGIDSAKKREANLGHILFSGESGFGKTTLGGIVANQLGVNIKIVTGYAITKPAEVISILNSLEQGDILFIDEIHRIRPNIEEILYIAMEDYAIDMVMPEGGSVRVPIKPFSLIGATTKLESLSTPLKNRFVYKFHFENYNSLQIMDIISLYLIKNNIKFESSVLEDIKSNVVAVPREISNFSVKLRDYLISKGANHKSLNLDHELWDEFKDWANVKQGGLNNMHINYLNILKDAFGKAVGLKTLSMKLGVNEKSIEEDIEPLLLKLGYIEKMSKGRVLLKDIDI